MPRASSFLAVALSLFFLAAAGSAHAGNECEGQAPDAPCASDGNDCTRDVCDGSGTCLHLNLPPDSACADDGSECTDDICNGSGVCVHFNYPPDTPCDSDGKECTRDVCNGSGQCQHQNLPPGAPCETDNNDCTRDGCDGGGTCLHSNLPPSSPCADDGDVCTRDVCNGGGTCAHFPVPNQSPCTDDGVGCTTDVCIGGACQHVGDATCTGGCEGRTDGTACASDANDCTLDQCISGTCEHVHHASGTRCTSDSNECTDDVCDGSGQCLHLTVSSGTPCASDNDACTADVCQGNSCEHFQVPSGVPCQSDSNECTSDVCFDGACEHFLVPTGVPCDGDFNECTRDRCDNGTCTSFQVPEGVPCLDEVDGCTNDVCSSGSCEHFLRPQCVTPPQAKPQQKCLMALNKGTSVLFKTLSKASLACIADALKGKTDAPDACLTADADGKLAEAKAKVTEKAGKLCTAGAIPDFGPSSAAAVIAAADAERLALLEDLFGEDLDEALLPADSKARAQCQSDVAKASAALTGGALKAFTKCKKTGIKTEIVSRAGLDACLDGVGADIASAETKLGKVAAKLVAASSICSLSDVDEAFPGRCAAVVTHEEFQECLIESSRCRICRILAAVDDLPEPCDVFDDGIGNQSCEQP